MTNLFDLYPNKPNRLLVIHGLNNNHSAFIPLTNKFKELGWDVHFITLPCHGENRKEASDFEEALICFDRSMQEMAQAPYHVIAFSQGALYLQLWIEKNPDHRPLSQVLLAPALFIHHHNQLERWAMFLPAFLHIKSLTPKNIRRYYTIRIRDYRILLHKIVAFQQLNGEFKIPTMVVIDPKDELVDARQLEKKLKNMKLELFPREYLKMGLGCHHIIFHPDYFNPEDWVKLTGLINTFLAQDNGVMHR